MKIYDLTILQSTAAPPCLTGLSTGPVTSYRLFCAIEPKLKRTKTQDLPKFKLKKAKTQAKFSKTLICGYIIT